MRNKRTEILLGGSVLKCKQPSVECQREEVLVRVQCQ